MINCVTANQLVAIFNMFGNVSFHFMTLDGVTSFLASKTYEIHVNVSFTVNFLGGISFYALSYLLNGTSL